MAPQPSGNDPPPLFNEKHIAESKSIGVFYATLNFLFSLSLAARNYFLRRPRTYVLHDVHWLFEVLLFVLTVSLAPLSVFVARRQSKAVLCSPEHREAVFWTTLCAINYCLFVAYMLMLWL